MTSLDLTGRTALVTGGGRGLGRAFALALADAGAEVAVLARSRHEVDAVAAEIIGAGGRALAVTGDVSEPRDLADAVQEVGLALGPVDVLVNNAGVVWPLGRTHLVDADEWQTAMEINLHGPFLACQAVLPGMLERGWGRIVNVSSGAAQGTGMPSSNAYSVSKAGLDMLTANLAAELRGSGVTVAGLSPGTVDTDMQSFIRAQDREEVGADLHDRFHALHDEGRLTGTERPVALLLALLAARGHGRDPRHPARARRRPARRLSPRPLAGPRARSPTRPPARLPACPVGSPLPPEASRHVTGTTPG